MMTLLRIGLSSTEWLYARMKYQDNFTRSYSVQEGIGLPQLCKFYLQKLCVEVYMPLDVIVGAQWGDEGKGRVVDLLAARRIMSPATMGR
jgi:hypothetical protein